MLAVSLGTNPWLVLAAAAGFAAGVVAGWRWRAGWQHGRLIRWQLAEARLDGLVGLANRRTFDEELARRWTRFECDERRFALLFIDVDRFKPINDRYGHLLGDEVLRSVGRVLAEVVRKSDFAARYGGDEFAILAPEATAAEAAVMAERLRAAVAQLEFSAAGAAVRATVSLGAAEASAVEGRDALLRHADQALYAAKHGGRNCVFVYEDGACRAFKGHPSE